MQFSWADAGSRYASDFDRVVSFVVTSFAGSLMMMSHYRIDEQETSRISPNSPLPPTNHLTL